MRMETKDLDGEALDWAVAKCEGRAMYFDEDGEGPWFADADTHPDNYQTAYGSWELCGPIIQREDINVTRHTHSEVTESGKEIYRKDGWTASTTPDSFWMTPIRTYGATPLVAAMRCYVTRKLGPVVDIPDELAPNRTTAKSGLAL